MPKPEKWADFTRTAVVSKQSKHGGAQMVDYAQFACPYNCGMPVEIPTSIVSNNKSTKCLSHLMRCSDVSDDGLKAEDDPRVKEIRLAASGKRARTDGAADVSETAIAIVPCNACVGREEENGRLIVRNDALHGRVQTLEEQNAAHVSTMQAMRGNMEQMQRELAALRLRLQAREALAAPSRVVRGRRHAQPGQGFAAGPAQPEAHGARAREHGHGRRLAPGWDQDVGIAGNQRFERHGRRGHWNQLPGAAQVRQG